MGKYRDVFPKDFYDTILGLSPSILKVKKIPGEINNDTLREIFIKVALSIMTVKEEVPELGDFISHCDITIKDNLTEAQMIVFTGIVDSYVNTRGSRLERRDALNNIIMQGLLFYVEDLEARTETKIELRVN